jgi:hypothetical protein
MNMMKPRVVKSGATPVAKFRPQPDPPKTK